ncbi:Tripartite-type tricarboxylate transporter, receptor component TctC [Noviherbaspirillum humi]|uniref:Tripartite-type tricarboxylate transporter, receptor component TctC n=1 Tax=Noviherbaspirillum humi TaxID=1688639 RepID=A0A239ITQ0_9BURK|nr:tripartite tricarboxylate transporter substrate binding protein [Noviherbaspirillum humi]SNS96762.1 Tripartite-type tricarboxylate transporter, receptor component TctC [Noviherbaspirillum humi]
MSHFNDIDQKRRQLTRMLLAAAGTAMAGATPALRAQPKLVNGQIKIIVPFTPGTTPDLCARLLPTTITKRLGQPSYVENRPGASGIIGSEAVAKAAPDGQTVMVSTNTALTLPYFYKKVPFDVINSFEPIGMIGNTNYALVAHPSFPASNVKEMIAYLKKNPNQVTYASPGKGTFHHLCMEQIASMTGVQWNHVPYKGSAPAFQDLLGGHVMLTIMPLHMAVPLANSGKLKIFGATRKEHDPTFPKVPTLHEAGVTNFNADGWYALWGPKGMSKELVAAYNAALREAIQSPDVKTTLDQQGINPKLGTPEELLKTARAEYEYWGKVIKDAKIEQE